MVSGRIEPGHQEIGVRRSRNTREVLGGWQSDRPSVFRSHATCRPGRKPIQKGCKEGRNWQPYIPRSFLCRWPSAKSGATPVSSIERRQGGVGILSIIGLGTFPSLYE